MEIQPSPDGNPGGGGNGRPFTTAIAANAHRRATFRYDPHRRSRVYAEIRPVLAITTKRVNPIICRSWWRALPCVRGWRSRRRGGKLVGVLQGDLRTPPRRRVNYSAGRHAKPCRS